jgi:hypothetical protein
VGHRAGVKPTNTLREIEPGWPTSIHAARRFIMAALPRASAMDLTASEGDPRGRSEEPPVLALPQPIEGDRCRAIRVAPERASRLESGFGAFLDGTQEVRVVNHCGGIPIVWATVSAAVRVRRHRRLVAWDRERPVVEARYYVPFRYLDDLPAHFRGDPRVVDTAQPDLAGAIPSRHPAALLERAMLKIQQDREAVEQLLAEAWCASESSTLYVDGSITASGVTSTSALAVGVIKSHRTLYADGDAFRVVVGLEAGERSSVFKVSPRSRNPVASWYVRVRSPRGRDALFGLVRVEAAESGDITSRADEISRWIIAEASPLALPDGRWDKMSYGIRDTEEFLRAIS